MRASLLCACVFSTSALAAPTVQFAGTCPGQIRIEVSNLTPGERAAFLWSDNAAGSLATRGECTGEPLDLGAPVSKYRTRIADASGEAFVQLNLPAGACNNYIEVIETGTCDSSPALRLPQSLPSTCTNFGDVVAEDFPPSGWIVDSNRIVVTPTKTYVAIFDEIHAYDHDLTNRSVVVSRVQPGGNKGLSYDPIADRIVGYNVASATAQLAEYSGDFSVLVAGPTTTSFNTGSGVIDPAGHLHVPMRIGTGIQEYDEMLNYVGVWGNAGSGRDIAMGPGDIAYHLSGTGTVTAYDLSDPNRSVVRSFPVITADGIDVADDGTIYVHSRSRLQVAAYAPDGTSLGAFNTANGEDPAALTYNPHNGMIVVGYYNSGTPIVRNHCPVMP